MFLKKDEVEELTGYKRFADQRRWLTKRSWKFEEAATGRPMVLRSYAETRMSAATVVPALRQPNIAAIRKSA